jgi:hypothetical protein
MWNLGVDLVQLTLDHGVEAIVGAIVGALGTLLGGLLKRTRERLRSVRAPWPRQGEQRAHLILLLGDTDVGKTMLIRQLFGFFTESLDAPDPQRPTQNTAVYTLLHESRTETEGCASRFDIVDYKGGQPENLIDDWPAVLTRTKLQEATAVVLVVDLFATGKKLDRDERERLEEKHLDRHLAMWTEGRLERIASKVTSKKDGLGPKPVVLFINKCDLWKQMTVTGLATGSTRRLVEVRTKFAPIEEALQRAFKRQVTTITGSMLEGIGVNVLFAKLRETSRKYPY